MTPVTPVTPTPDPGSDPDHDETAGPAQGPSSPESPPVASVAEEAALLIDLLSQRSSAPPSSTRPTGMPSPRSRADDAADAAPDDARAHQARDDRRSRAGEGQAGECTCGGTTPAACRVCPVCQLIAVVQQVNPDTIERVADFVGFAATALRDLAAAQRERRPEPPPDTPTGSTSPGETE